MSDKWDEIRNAVKDAVLMPVEERVREFLSTHVDARDFLVERAERLGKLAARYASADDGERPAVLNSMKVVRQTMELEVSRIALEADIAARATFKAVLGTAIDAVIKIVPVLMGA